MLDQFFFNNLFVRRNFWWIHTVLKCLPSFLKSILFNENKNIKVEHKSTFWCWVYLTYMAMRWRHHVSNMLTRMHMFKFKTSTVNYSMTTVYIGVFLSGCVCEDHLTSCSLATGWDLFVLQSVFSHLLLGTGAERKKNSLLLTVDLTPYNEDKKLLKYWNFLLSRLDIYHKRHPSLLCISSYHLPWKGQQTTM